MKKPKAPPRDNVAGVLAAIRKEVGEDGAMVLSDDRLSFRIRGVVPFGCVGIDRSIGRGGAPLGRLTILHGGEGSGKTTAALSLCAQAQAQGGMAVYIDKEFKLDADWAASLGVERDKLIMANSRTLEGVIGLMKRVVAWASKARQERGESYPIVIVLDSINACTSKAVLEGDEDAAHVAPEARVWSRHLSALIEAAARENVALVFISQIRKKIGITFGDDQNLAGGEAPKFYASCIGFFRRVGKIKDGDVKANRVEVEWKKNQIAPPFRKAHFLIRFPPAGAGFDNERSLIEVAESLEIVTKKGNALKFDGKSLGIGYEAARQKLIRRPELTAKILEKIAEFDKAGAPVVEEKQE